MKKEKKPLGLSTKIFIALLLGAVFGVIVNYCVPAGYFKDTVLINGILYVIGNGFIRLMQMLVIPLVMCSLICGAMAIGDTKTLGKVGVKTIGFYLVTTALAIAVALATGLIVKPGVGLDISAVETSEVTVAEATSCLISFQRTFSHLWQMVICFQLSYFLYLWVFFLLRWVRKLQQYLISSRSLMN